MGFVYFLIPVVGGYGVMQWAIGKAHASIGADGEHLPVKEIQGLGDKRVVVAAAATLGDSSSSSTNSKEEKVKIMTRTQTVGAGGWGGGVHLAVSDQETQRKNREKLNQFLVRQKQRHEKQQQQRVDNPEKKQ